MNILICLFSLAWKTVRDLPGFYVWRPERLGSKSWEVETPVATATVKETEFKVLPDGQATLTVVEGMVEFGTAFGTCPIKNFTLR
ncbi:MAG TPA: FecR domain-containing protein [Nitrospirales bacterium]|nr:FecR domain-containing protein [Nitrospirales bacterium]